MSKFGKSNDTSTKTKKVVFDVDHTLIDEKGESVRPGIVELLKSLKDNGVELAVWTASFKARSEPILRNLGLIEYFSDFTYREDYNTDSRRWISVPKDIRKTNGDILVDDSQKQVDYVNSTGLIGYKMTPYASTEPYNNPDMSELEELHRMILPDVEFSLQTNTSLFNKITSIFRLKKYF